MFSAHLDFDLDFFFNCCCCCCYCFLKIQRNLKSSVNKKKKQKKKRFQYNLTSDLLKNVWKPSQVRSLLNHCSRNKMSCVRYECLKDVSETLTGTESHLLIRDHPSKLNRSSVFVMDVSQISHVDWIANTRVNLK